MTTITIPIDVAEAAAEALGNFVSDHGWSDSDMQAMDNLDAYIQRHKAIRAELAKPVEPSYTATQLAAMVLSDCGISTDHTALHERVAARITRHEDDLIDRLKKLEKQDTPAWHDAPTEPGVWACLYQGEISTTIFNAYEIENFDAEQMEDCRWYGPIQQEGDKP